MMCAVVKQGVYIQDVWGPFADEASAKVRALELARADSDRYHSYDVRAISVADGLDGGIIASFKKPR